MPTTSERRTRRVRLRLLLAAVTGAAAGAIRAATDWLFDRLSSSW